MFKYKVERPQAGQALITLLNGDGSVMQEHLETDPVKADAMTDALDSVGKLGVELGPGA